MSFPAPHPAYRHVTAEELFADPDCIWDVVDREGVLPTIPSRVPPSALSVGPVIPGYRKVGQAARRVDALGYVLQPLLVTPYNSDFMGRRFQDWYSWKARDAREAERYEREREWAMAVAFPDGTAVLYVITRTGSRPRWGYATRAGSIYLDRFGKEVPGEVIEDGESLEQAVKRAHAHMRKMAGERKVGSTTEIDVDAIARHLDDVLDTEEPSPRAKKAFRPMLPMTLVELRGLAAKTGPVPFKTNPAPLLKAAKRTKDAGRRFSPYWHTAGQGRGPDSEHGLRDRAAEVARGMAWARSAPEGFPPYPRRGDTYSADEATAIGDWVTEAWPAVREANQIVAAADRRLSQSTVVAAAARILHGVGGGDSYLLAPLYRDSAWSIPRAYDFNTFKPNDDPSRYAPPDATDLTPKELVERLTAWGIKRLLPAVALIEALSDPHLYEKWSNVDEHYRTLHRITNETRAYDAPRHLVSHLYQLDRTTVNAQHRPLADYLSALPVPPPGYYTPSQALAQQQANDDAYKQREATGAATKKAEWAVLAPALWSHIEKGNRTWSLQNIRNALPSGYVLHTETRDFTIQGPSRKTFLYYSDGGKARDAQLEGLRQQVRQVVEGNA